MTNSFQLDALTASAAAAQQQQKHRCSSVGSNITICLFGGAWWHVLQEQVVFFRLILE
jgi:hypothetical protein